MRTVILRAALLASFTSLAACHPGPVVGHREHVGGTISGVVSSSGASTALSGRKVTVINVATSQRYETTTAANGGYTVQVPEGTYRIELELRAGETLAKSPGQTHVSNSDLDSHRDFVVTIARQPA